MKRETKIVSLALALAIITFILGFLFSSYVYSLKLREYRIFSQNLLASLIGLDLIRKDGINLCNLSEQEIFENKVRLGRMLTALESRVGKKNLDVLSLKEIYEIIEIKTLNLLKDIESECNKKFIIILFFYSNFENNTLSMDQGAILDTLVNEFEDKDKKLYVFSFSLETNNPASKFLRKKYNITQIPSLVINSVSYKGFQGKNYLKEVLK